MKKQMKTSIKQNSIMMKLNIHSCFVIVLSISILLFFSAKGVTSELLPAPVVAHNNSYQTDCAEEDNVNVSFIGETNTVVIKATHPEYPINTLSCAANFDSCVISTNSDYLFSNPVKDKKLYDDGNIYLLATRQEKWWRPTGMKVWVNNNNYETDIHYIEIGQKTSDANEWPIFFALYEDGNLRLISHPPSKGLKTCFGSSVMVGSAEVANRPFADIETLHFISASRTIELLYSNGDQFNIVLGDVSRSDSQVRVEFNKVNNSQNPLITLRSMFVTENNADVAKVEMSKNKIFDIMEFKDNEGAATWKFFRSISSQHNQSAPDLTIDFYKKKANCNCAELSDDYTIVAENFYFRNQLYNASFTLSPIIKLSDLEGHYWQLKEFADSFCEDYNEKSSPIVNEDFSIVFPCIRYKGEQFNLSINLIFTDEGYWKFGIGNK